jgi:hypothetical protein
MASDGTVADPAGEFVAVVESSENMPVASAARNTISWVWRGLRCGCSSYPIGSCASLRVTLPMEPGLRSSVTSATRMLNDLAGAELHGQLDRTLRRYCHADFLVIDDFAV